MTDYRCTVSRCRRLWRRGPDDRYHKEGDAPGCFTQPMDQENIDFCVRAGVMEEEPMTDTPTGRINIPNVDGKLKARGQGQPPRKYTLGEWMKGYAAWTALLPVYALLALLAAIFGHIPPWITKLLLRWHEKTTESRQYDVRIPGAASIPAYMWRWWKIKRNAYFNIYFHRVWRSDEDIALHDHPWWSFSIVLEGGYWEHRIKDGGIHVKTWHGPGSILFRRSGDTAHRLELEAGVSGELPAKTIFITGPVLRRWGFHDAKNGWIDAYDWDEHCAAHGMAGMKMSGYAEQLKKGT